MVLYVCPMEISQICIRVMEPQCRVSIPVAMSSHLSYELATSRRPWFCQRGQGLQAYNCTLLDRNCGGVYAHPYGPLKNKKQGRITVIDDNPRSRHSHLHSAPITSDLVRRKLRRLNSYRVIHPIKYHFMPEVHRTGTDGRPTSIEILLS
jgi:hypothetical protein